MKKTLTSLLTSTLSVPFFISCGEKESSTSLSKTKSTLEVAPQDELELEVEELQTITIDNGGWQKLVDHWAQGFTMSDVNGQRYYLAGLDLENEAVEAFLGEQGGSIGEKVSVRSDKETCPECQPIGLEEFMRVAGEIDQGFTMTEINGERVLLAGFFDDHIGIKAFSSDMAKTFYLTVY